MQNYHFSKQTKKISIFSHRTFAGLIISCSFQKDFRCWKEGLGPHTQTPTHVRHNLFNSLKNNNFSTLLLCKLTVLFKLLLWLALSLSSEANLSRVIDLLWFILPKDRSSRSVYICFTCFYFKFKLLFKKTPKQSQRREQVDSKREKDCILFCLPNTHTYAYINVA